MKPIKRIVFATDFSKASRRAFDAAVALARSNDARLTMVHVHVPPIPFVSERYIESPKWASLENETKRWNTQQLAALVSRARKQGVAASSVLVDGEPSRQIVKTARGRHADMVVIGTHGRTGFSRLLLGSVAARVAATSTCPVLTVRG
jgi:nucleotide-binding universal stress UspA family protein